MAVELKKITQLAWRRFLDSDAGREGLLWLHEQRPSVYKGQPHEIAFDAGVSQGYEQALSKMTEILSTEPKREINVEND